MNARLDTHALLDLAPDEIKLVEAETGSKLRFETRKKAVIGPDGKITSVRVQIVSTVNSSCLKLDTLIETEKGSMTFQEFWGSEYEKLRCQATFRDSTSMNGILSFHKDFAPFLYDNGERIKYVLSAADLQRGMGDAWITRLSKMPKEQVLKVWTNPLRAMDGGGKQRIIEFVSGLTGHDDKELKAELKECETRWREEAIAAENEQLVANIEREGRIAVFWNPAQLPEILVRVENKVLPDAQNELVLSHTQGLGTVRRSRPTTVREVIREVSSDDSLATGLVIDRYRQNAFGLRLSASCEFLKISDSGCYVAIAPPFKLVQTMLEVSYRSARPLVGIIEHPAVKEDASLTEGQGYDIATGFYIQVQKELIPELPESITRQAASASMQWIIDNVLADFPFASSLDCAGAVSLILTIIQRRLMTGGEGAPMFATTAPVQASGKTSLVRVAAYLALGIGVPVTSWPTNDEEMGKHLLAILMEGLPIVLFDNLPEGGKIESNELAKAATSEKYRRRILGENREGEAPTNVVWVFTGNNIQAVGDFNTRTIAIYLDPDDENPDQRSFSRNDLETWCLEHRAEFFRHALTILVGYRRLVLAGGQDRDRPFHGGYLPSRFRDWDLQVRDPMIWAGAEDPAKLFERNKAEDPQKEGRAQLLAAWNDVYGQRPVQLRQVLQDCSHGTYDEKKGELRDAINDIAPNGQITSKTFSTIVQKFVNQWIGGYRLQKAQQSDRSRTSAKWFVECSAEVRDDTADE
jgi:hypothetical protein